jgi:hypothetical protein
MSAKRIPSYASGSTRDNIQFIHQMDKISILSPLYSSSTRIMLSRVAMSLGNPWSACCMAFS